jgi:hypothetical protein
LLLLALLIRLSLLPQELPCQLHAPGLLPPRPQPSLPAPSPALLLLVVLVLVLVLLLLLLLLLGLLAC